MSPDDDIGTWFVEAVFVVVMLDNLVGETCPFGFRPVRVVEEASMSDPILALCSLLSCLFALRGVWVRGLGEGCG